MARQGRAIFPRNEPFYRIPSDLCNTVYLIEFDDGVIKVGFTNRPRERMVQHSGAGARVGRAIKTFELFPGNQQSCPFQRDPDGTERRAIAALYARCSPMPDNTEAFSGISFDEARAIVLATLET